MPPSKRGLSMGSMDLHPDFRDLLSALAATNAEYLAKAGAGSAARIDAAPRFPDCGPGRYGVCGVTGATVAPAGVLPTGPGDATGAAPGEGAPGVTTSFAVTDPRTLFFWFLPIVCRAARVASRCASRRPPPRVGGRISEKSYEGQSISGRQRPARKRQQRASRRRARVHRRQRRTRRAWCRGPERERRPQKALRRGPEL